MLSALHCVTAQDATSVLVNHLHLAALGRAHNCTEDLIFNGIRVCPNIGNVSNTKLRRPSKYARLRKCARNSPGWQKKPRLDNAEGRASPGIIVESDTEAER